MPTVGPYDRAIQDVENQARDLEVQARDIGRRLAKLNEVIASLRELASEDSRARLPAQPVEPSAPSSNGARAFALEAERSANIPSSYQKGDIVRLVEEALEAHPGLRSSQLGDLLKDRVTSGAKNPRKLILSAVSYLASRHRVRRSDTGGWELVNR